MLQKYLSGAKIAYFSIIIALFGIFLPLLTVDFQTAPKEAVYTIGFIKYIFQSLHLTVFNLEDWFTFQIGTGRNMYIYYNVLNTFFYVLLILGAIFYLRSKQKETRLLRFVYSLIFITKISSFIIGLFSIIFRESAEQSLGAFFYVLWFLDYAVLALYVYLSFSILKYIEKGKTFETIERTYETHTSVTLVESGRWRRFFHLIMDDFIMILVFSASFEFLIKNEKIRPFIDALESGFGDRGAFIVIVAIFRVFYYGIFELVLGVTAAKTLSETRVADEEGNKPAVSAVLKRTFLRLVPFEALTFFMPRGLHDRWSETYVIKEKRTGAQGAWYLLIVPATIVIGLLIAFGIHKYDSIQAERKAQAVAQQNKEIFADKLKKLSTNDFIHLEPLEYSYSDIYLKTEEIKPDGITFIILDAKKDYSHIKINGKILNEYNMPNFLEKIYAIEKESAKKVTISRSQLQKAMELNSTYNYSNQDTIGALNIGDWQKYSIKDIETYFMPRLVVLDNYSVDQIKNVVLANNGWKAELINVTNAQLYSGQQLPMPLDKQANAIITVPSDENFKFQVKIKDTLGRMFSYEVSKEKELDAIIKRTE
ncbi:RDD family protein [Flavobacterium microcysteis]|uniref:RDD family protein n=1 Tax=Flavobacterium microcysteis TaxID=2596891 RepID=A0A501Q5S3_9FLAO|nr:RDD family protein [Flavobacterium microcysteis]TPD68240.1 RDD family protein [Flavobacterium microcysteis]